MSMQSNSSNNNNFSVLLQFLHQEISSARTGASPSLDQEQIQERLLSHFKEAQCDQSQLDLLRSSIHKAALDTNAFKGTANRSSGSGGGLETEEFSRRLVNELSKKYRDTKEICSKLEKAQQICQGSMLAGKMSLDDSVNQFRDVRLSTLNLQRSMIQISEHQLQSRSCKSGGRDSRNLASYDEQILTLRKKLSVSYVVIFGIINCAQLSFLIRFLFFLIGLETGVGD
jgi:hypothetical protein